MAHVPPNEPFNWDDIMKGHFHDYNNNNNHHDKNKVNFTYTYLTLNDLNQFFFKDLNESLYETIKNDEETYFAMGLTSLEDKIKEVEALMKSYGEQDEYDKCMFLRDIIKKYKK